MLSSAIAQPWPWHPLRRCLGVPLASGAMPLSPSPTAGAMAASHRSRCRPIYRPPILRSQCDINSF